MDSQPSRPADRKRHPIEHQSRLPVITSEHCVNFVHRYAAKLLFQYRVDVDGDPGKRRVCEERIVVFEAKDAHAALKKSQRRGKHAEHSYSNDRGNTVYFEFIGIIDLLELGIECDEDEVWYDIRERMLPMESRKKLIPPEHELNAIRNGPKKRG